MKTLFTITAALLLLTVSCESKMSPAEELALDKEVEAQIEKDLEKARMEEMKADFSWKYETETDEMTSKKVKHAQITSPDVAVFDFPYEGSQFLTLYLRNNDGKVDAFISISEGQFHEDYDNPTINFRFDQDPPIAFTVSESADADAAIRFINKSDAFIKRLKTAKTLKIEAMFYEQGNRIFNFDVSGLKWD
jgi:hypothetical protein